MRIRVENIYLINKFKKKKKEKKKVKHPHPHYRSYKNFKQFTLFHTTNKNFFFVFGKQKTIKNNNKLIMKNNLCFPCLDRKNHVFAFGRKEMH